MDVHDLRRLVAVGEGPHLEFKFRVPRPNRIAKEVIALANSGGGKVLLGVGDDGALVGLKDTEEELFALRAALASHCEPPVQHAIEGVRISRRREVVVIDVPPSTTKPHFLVHGEEEGQNGQAVNGRKKAYVRVGDESIEASREAVRLMRAERRPRDVRFTFGEKEQLLMKYLEERERITVRQFARLAGLPRKRASQTLVLLAEARVLRFHADSGEDYFTVAYKDA